MVFPKVKCPGDHAEGERHVQGCSVIVPSAGTINVAVDFRMDGRHGGESVTVDGLFQIG